MKLTTIIFSLFLTIKPSIAVIPNKDISCLTEAIYHESRGEPISGQIAVANVVKNRVENKNFPNDYCSVVHQKGQFSYFWDNKPEIYKNKAAFKVARRIAKKIVFDYLKDNTNGAIFFTTKKLKNHKLVKIIGNHLFYV